VHVSLQDVHTPASGYVPLGHVEEHCRFGVRKSFSWQTVQESPFEQVRHVYWQFTQRLPPFENVLAGQLE
jgi:hypothetical protein